MKCPNCKVEIDYVKVAYTTKALAVVDKHGMVCHVKKAKASGGIIIALCPECDYNITKSVEDGVGFFG